MIVLGDPLEGRSGRRDGLPIVERRGKRPARLPRFRYLLDAEVALERCYELGTSFTFWPQSAP